MLYSLLLLAVQGNDAIARFEDFCKRTQSFSVQIAATSLSAGSGKGTLTVVKPNSFRLTMKWPSEDYTMVRSSQGTTEFERLSKMYMEYPAEPGLHPYESSVADYQQEAIVTPLLSGTLKGTYPPNATITGAKAENGAQRVTATWKGQDGGACKMVAKIAADGRLLYFEELIEMRQGDIHHQYDFSNYVIPTKITSATFNLVPPLGFTMHHRQVEYLYFSPGDRPKLASWSSASGKVQLENAARGKLLIVREPKSRPADRLLAYLKGQKLPVKTAIASLGATGGDYWAPPRQVADSLSVVGTPLSILLDAKGVVLGMWVGFDADNPDQLLKEIKEALEENSTE